MDPNLPRPQTPNQTTQYQTVNPNYLDQIATPVQKKTINPIFLWGMIGAFILVLIVGTIMLLSSGGPNQSERINSFIHRVQALDKLSNDSAKTIQSSELRALNGSMNTILTGIDTAMQASLGDKESKRAANIPKDSPVALEYEALAKKLDDARLNVAFDRAYAREVEYQLNKLRSEMNYIYDSTKSQTLRTNLERADADIEKLSEDFGKFNG